MAGSGAGALQGRDDPDRPRRLPPADPPRPQACRRVTAPRHRTFALILGALAGMGPFSVDMYLPAFFTAACSVCLRRWRSWCSGPSKGRSVGCWPSAWQRKAPVSSRGGLQCLGFRARKRISIAPMSSRRLRGARGAHQALYAAQPSGCTRGGVSDCGAVRDVARPERKGPIRAAFGAGLSSLVARLAPLIAGSERRCHARRFSRLPACWSAPSCWRGRRKGRRSRTSFCHRPARYCLSADRAALMGLPSPLSLTACYWRLPTRR